MSWSSQVPSITGLPRLLRRRIGKAALGRLLARGYAKDVPRSRFGARSTAEEVTEGLDLTGISALVTGSSSGIGYETARTLALRGAHVLVTARTQEQAQSTSASIEGHTTPLELELSDPDSVVACAAQVRAITAQLDLVICNAGVLLSEPAESWGLEWQFRINHLGHFILVNNLMAPLSAASAARVVVVGSSPLGTPPDGGIQFQDLSSESTWRGGSAYFHSKLANSLFSLELVRRLSGSRVSSNCVHPGTVDTNIFRHHPGASGDKKTVECGAATTCYVATSSLLDGVSGYFFADCNPATPGAHMQDAKMAARLWKMSEELSRGYLPSSADRWPPNSGPPDTLVGLGIESHTA